MGNAAITALVQAQPAPAQAPYDPKALANLLSWKGKAKNSLLAQVIEAQTEAISAHQKQDPRQEVAALARTADGIRAWKTKHPDDASAKSAEIAKLQRSIDQRLPAVEEAARATWAQQELGLPAAMVIQLGADGVRAVREAYKMLLKMPEATDTSTADALRTGADAKLQTIAPLVGGSVGLIRAMLMRHALPALNPELAQAITRPDYALKDAATVRDGAARAKDLGTERLGDLQAAAADATNPKKGVAEMELRFQAGALQDLPAAAERLREPGEKPPKGEQGQRRRKEQEQRKKALKGMPNEEATAILSYTSNGFTKFNQPLRDDPGSVPRNQAALTLLAISGLNRMKPATGQVFRHGGLFPGFKELNQVGATVVDMGFLSTARDQPGCIPGAVSHEVLEIITSKSGRDVSPLSLFGSGEREVLFKPGTRFRVTAVYEVTAGVRSDGTVDPDASRDGKKNDIKLVIHKTEV